MLDSLPSAMLGRRPPQKKSFLASLAQLWSRPPYPEVRDYSGGKVTEQRRRGARSAARQATGDEVRVFLQDVPGVLEKNRTAQLGPGRTLRRDRRARAHAAHGHRRSRKVRPSCSSCAGRACARFANTRRNGKQHIDRLYRERSLAHPSAETPLLKNLSDEALRQGRDAHAVRELRRFRVERFLPDGARSLRPGTSREGTGHRAGRRLP